MKSKSEKRFFGIFKKKTTPAPAAPPPNDSNRTTPPPSSEETAVVPEPVMPPRKGSVAQTSVIHYSPPGTVRASFPPSATSSVVSDGSDETAGSVVVTRKSNIVLEDEESVISTPVSQYDESPIVQKQRTKRAAPPPPPPPAAAAAAPISPKAAPTPQSPAPNRVPHYRQTSTASVSSTIPPPPPPHRKQENGIDYEAMYKSLLTKFDEWNQMKLADGGSIREERMKAEVLKEHERLKMLLDNQITSDLPKTGSASSQSSSSSGNNNHNNNNNNVKKQLPLKIPQYGNFYSQPSQPAQNRSPPVAPQAAPGGTVYKRTSREKLSPKSPVPNGNIISPKTDENRNIVVTSASPKNPPSQNTVAVDRLRREVEEQRQREKEVKQYRNPRALESQASPRKSSPGPRMVEYKAMKSPGLEPDGVYEEIAPPIPKNPPPKLSDYRKEQQTVVAPRMPSVPTNGYVRLQMNGKKPAPVTPHPVKLSPTPYTGPEYSSSPKLLRKTPEPAKIYSSVPVKEEKKVYEKPQAHPQIAPPMVRAASVDQNGNNYQRSKPVEVKPRPVSSPLMIRAASVDQNPMTASPSVIRKSQVTATQSPVSYRKIPPTSPTPQRRPLNNTEVPSPVTYRKISAPVQKVTSPAPPAARSVSTDQPPPANRRSQVGILSATSSKATVTVTSATSPPYPKGSVGPTVISIKPAPVQQAPMAPRAAPTKVDTSFDISDVLKGPKLRKVGMPAEKSGISLGKVVESVEASGNRPSSTPPPPPPPPPLAAAPPQPKNPDLRDSLMNEIREAGRLRAARVAQSA
ncbi:WH2 domain-containing protein [Caenorhabditis elegans]|uniref:WH2 domain-containing protein n=1 Tax=Caenorhabditis elegans TaxID=6239 RepID=Q9U225_CAEEL|nr:WH2 domain-containing protein [Caenorhabditis elegans]CAB60515.1 WH2 domain-containing protein [Caenorhabditis elegans]|eukprot:NP_499539.1 Uncharacterized protein CELE_Y56A3A.6 [Caenorhabditis elegans]